MIQRRRAREAALHLLFQWEYDNSLSVSEAEKRIRQSFVADPRVWAYAHEIAEAYFNNRDNIDSRIRENTARWTLERMSMVDRNVLRISATELLYFNHEVPARVVINEAIEIARKFGTSDSSSFVNGVLDQMARQWLDDSSQ